MPQKTLANITFAQIAAEALHAFLLIAGIHKFHIPPFVHKSLSENNIAIRLSISYADLASTNHQLSQANNPSV